MSRLLGVDFGTVRIGLAITDPDRIIASPLQTLVRRTTEADAEFFRRLVRQEDVGAIVVGLPIHTTGTIGQKANEAVRFGKWLAEVTKVPVYFWDERFTSVEAESSLLSAGLTRDRRKQRRDAIAAQILLQSYLEAGCPTDYEPTALDE